MQDLKETQEDIISIHSLIQPPLGQWFIEHLLLPVTILGTGKELFLIIYVVKSLTYVCMWSEEVTDKNQVSVVWRLFGKIKQGDVMESGSEWIGTVWEALKEVMLEPKLNVEQEETRQSRTRKWSGTRSRRCSRYRASSWRIPVNLGSQERILWAAGTTRMEALW